MRQLNNDKEVLDYLEIIIRLLGRIAFTEDRVIEIISFKKQNPEKYIAGYNACDGKRSFSEIAQIVGVTAGTLSPILQDWENKMIVYSIEKEGKKFYKNLFKIENKKRQHHG